jgi:hypothetical protein
MRTSRTPTQVCLAMAAMTLLTVPDFAAQSKKAEGKPSAASAKSESPKPDLSVDEARMIVKEIPSVDIKATLARWKLAEPELVQLRQWSAQLVESPSRTDLIPKWAELITQVASRNRQLKESDIAPLIRMVMLAAYEEAQKYQDQPGAANRANVYKELQEQIRANLTQARQLQAMTGSERRDPLAGSRLSLPGYQRTLRKCQVLTGSPQKLECNDVLVSTSYELDDFISTSEAQLKKAEEDAKSSAASEGQQERRRQILYALSDVAKGMHDSAAAAMRKRGS